MNDFLITRIKQETEYFYYWSLTASKQIKDGEIAMYATLVASEHASEIEKLRAILRDRDNDIVEAINWNKIAHDAHSVAKARLLNETKDE